MAPVSAVQEVSEGGRVEGEALGDLELALPVNSVTAEADVDPEEAAEADS